MSRGRKRIPDHLKLVTGTARPDRMNPDAPEPSEELPRAPGDLPLRAVEIFGQLTATLDGMGLASKSDTQGLSLLAYRLYQVEQCRAVIDREGMTYVSETVQGGLMVRARPEVAILDAAARHANGLLSEFGLTPASRSKVSAKKKQQGKANPFGALTG